MRIEIRDVGSLPTGWARRRWRHSCVGTAAGRIAGLASDSRWQVRYVTGWDQGDLVGVLPVCVPMAERMWDRDYDVAALFTGTQCRPPKDARRWLFVGGCGDLAAGPVTSPDYPAHAVGAALFAGAVTLADAERRLAVGAYLRSDDLAAFKVAAGERLLERDLDGTAVLELPLGGMDDYLGMLGSPRRNKIRRDWRSFDEAGLRSSELSIADAIPQAAELVAALKRRHGIPDHPRLAALRLRRWMDLALGEYRVFGAIDRTGTLVAACFTCEVGTALDVYEIGLTNDESVRLQAYLECAFYGPIRHALAHRLRTVELGSTTIETKRLRGARVEPVWAAAVQPAHARDWAPHDFWHSDSEQSGP